MANYASTRTVIEGSVSDVNTTKKYNLGERFCDESGNEYIYLAGVASTGAGSWVTYDEAFATTLLAANAVGPVAIALGAYVASTYGWYQIFGVNTVAKTDTVAADKALYIDGTAGRADDAVVSGDLIVNACSSTADSTNVATVFITYPFVTDVLG